MPHQMKIATCNYCSNRTMLKPSARDGHELACGSCGAPLHDMKWLKAPEAARPQTSKVKSAPRRKAAPYPAYKETSYRKKKSRKPRKTLFRKVLEEAWDVLEDIID